MRQFIVALIMLAGCAPDESNYAGQPGGSQALAGCRAQSWQIGAAAANPGSNAFLVAAMQAQFIGDCMRARGYVMQ